MLNSEDEWVGATYYLGSWDDGAMKTGGGAESKGKGVSGIDGGKYKVVEVTGSVNIGFDNSGLDIDEISTSGLRKSATATADKNKDNEAVKYVGARLRCTPTTRPCQIL